MRSKCATATTSARRRARDMSPDACCAHDHDCDASTCGNASLHAFVDVPAVTAFNAREDDAAPGVIRAWERRHDRTGRALVSEDDGELVIRIPFTTDVKLRGVMVLGGADGRAPREMRAFANRRDIDAMNASLRPVRLCRNASSHATNATRDLTVSTRCMKRSQRRSVALAAFLRSQIWRHDESVCEERRSRSLRAMRRSLRPPVFASVHAFHAALSLTFRILTTVFRNKTLRSRLVSTASAHVSK